MATTRIWDVKDNLKRVLDYISNPDKTTVSESDYHYNGLSQVIKILRLKSNYMSVVSTVQWQLHSRI